MNATAGIRCSRSVSGCVPDRGGQQGGVGVGESGDNVAEVGGDACGEAG